MGRANTRKGRSLMINTTDLHVERIAHVLQQNARCVHARRRQAGKDQLVFRGRRFVVPNVMSSAL